MPYTRTPEHCVDQLRQALLLIEGLGVRIAPASRFRQYLATLERALRGDSIDPAIRGQAHLEASQLVTVAAALLDKPSPAVLRKLQGMVGDPLLPGMKGSPGRDAGFELLTAALIKKGGLAVRLDEPDIVVATDHHAIGIAAKRIKSLASLQSRLRDARRQLRRQGRGESPLIDHGLIALDVTYATNPKGLVPLVYSAPGQPAAAQSTAQLDAPVSDVVRAWANDGPELRLVASILVYAAMTEYDPKTGTITDGACIRNLILDRGSQEVLAPLAEAIQASLRP